MARSPEAIVEPALLVWAREAAGMSVEDAGKKLNAKKTGAYAEKIRQWEEPDDPARPSVSQLRRLAAAYKRPLASSIWMNRRWISSRCGITDALRTARPWMRCRSSSAPN